MTETIHNELERQLGELFDRQHHAIVPSPRTWESVLTVAAVDVAAPNVGTRRRIAAASFGFAGGAAVIAIALGVAYVVGGGHSAVKTQPRAGSSSPRNNALPPGACTDGVTPATFACSGSVHWDTPQVHLDGSDFSILTVGPTGAQTFTAKDPALTVHSDPGDAKYQTLELKWHENGVEQRWYIYFASDSHNWWATEMRTYDGNANTEWVYFNQSPYFRTPLGSAWSGDLDVTATDHGVTSHLRMQISHLQAFLSHGAALPNESDSAAAATT